MKVVNDELLDKVIEELDTIEEEFDKLIQDFDKKQPVIMSYINSEAASILTDEEKDYLQYLALTIFRTVEYSAKIRLPEISDKALSDAEEENWQLWEAAKGADFNEKLDTFFEDYPQEDLLAFVEDAISEEDPDDPEDDVDFITEEGRLPMFIILKTIIDAMNAAA
jgi:hypothetical protein